MEHGSKMFRWQMSKRNDTVWDAWPKLLLKLEAVPDKRGKRDKCRVKE